jgi:uncharacterized glyoxalase superfamily protein PhnB
MLANRSMPPGTIIPEVAYPDVLVAAEWLCRALGFTERLRIGTHRFQLQFGDASIVVVERAGAGAPSGCGGIMLRVVGIDAYYAKAVAAGAQSIGPPTDYPFGERQCSVLDPGGHRWIFSESIAAIDPASWGGQLTAR